MTLGDLDKLFVEVFKNHKAFDRIIKNFVVKEDMKKIEVMALRLMCHNEGGFSAHDLGEYTCYDKAIISRTLNNLRTQGFIERNPDDDGISRGYRFILTEKGRKIVGEMNEGANRLAEMVLQDISPNELDEFYRIIVRITESMKKIEKKLAANEEEA